MATRAVWVSLQDARGRLLITGQILQPDELSERFASPGFRVYLGNGAVRPIRSRPVGAPQDDARRGPTLLSVAAIYSVIVDGAASIWSRGPVEPLVIWVTPAVGLVLARAAARFAVVRASPLSACS
jgi:hypothetical protein